MSIPQFSICIPCYNSSQWLPACLDSILNQTFRNFELLVCDDCSTDNTYEILQQYAQKDGRVILMKNESNQGGLITRSRLFRHAVGEWSMWMDSDDTLELDFFELAAKCFAQTPDCDILEFPYEFIYEDGHHKLFDHPSGGFKAESLGEFFLSGHRHHLWLMWSKFIRTSVMKRSLPPEERILLDDVFFGLPIFSNSKYYRWVDTGKAMYHYRFFGGTWNSYDKHPTLERVRNLCNWRYKELVFNLKLLAQQKLPLKCAINLVKSADLQTLPYVIRQLPIQEQLEGLKIFFEFFCKKGTQLLNGYRLQMTNAPLMDFLKKYLPYIPAEYIDARMEGVDVKKPLPKKSLKLYESMK